MGGVRKIQLTQWREELISRIPGLFPFIGYDDDGQPHIYPASMSSVGSYGQLIADVIIDNVQISYRTALNRYYDLKQVEEPTEDDLAFIAAIDYYIGKIETPNIETYEANGQTDVPDFVYLALIPQMIEEYLELKRYADLLPNIPRAHEHYPDVCCKAAEYNRRGGDTFLTHLKSLIAQRTSRADELYNRVKDLDISRAASYGFCVNLYSSIDDMGVVTPVARAWVAGEENNEGDTILFDDSSWVATERTYGFYNEETEEIEFDGNNVTTTIEGAETTNSDKQQKLYPTGTYSEYATACSHYHNSFTPSPTPLFNDIKMTDDASVPFTQRGDNDILHITGHTNSKLTKLRRYPSYVNVLGEIETPPQDEDWLCYYREGYITNIETKRDDNDNIALLSNVTPSEGDDVENLCAYGDVLSFIDFDEDTNEITFEYILGAHLKAVLVEIATDDDGNALYKYEEFTVDETSEYGKNCGVRYTETHQAKFTLDSIRPGVSGEESEFQDYVLAVNRYEKFPFDANCITTVFECQNQQYDHSETRAFFETDIDKRKEKLLHIPIVREDYLLGAAYQPKVESDVRIERGNAAAFERFLKLAEIKTFEDLESYGNYGFFNLTSET